MQQIILQNISKSYGSTSAVKGLSLTVGQGELMALLGPSGCGKTTTLRMIAGFITPTEGRISIGGNDVTTLPPYRRSTGMVFQGYALFPHMTVSQNVAFGLEMRKVDKTEIQRRVGTTLEAVRLNTLADRYPKQLSGGQQQRVALARALVIEPDVLLLDEPLSNLDAKLRNEVRIEIRRIQKELGLTTVLVTHDQEEALSVADRLVLMNGGAVAQIGTPQDLYDRPENAFVADFIGASNFFNGRVINGGLFETVGGLRLRILPGSKSNGTVLAVRPENVRLTGPGNPTDGENFVTGHVADVTYLGSLVKVTVVIPTGELVTASIPASEYHPMGLGGQGTLSWNASAGRVVLETSH